MASVGNVERGRHRCRPGPRSVDRVPAGCRGWLTLPREEKPQFVLTRTEKNYVTLVPPPWRLVDITSEEKFRIGRVLVDRFPTGARILIQVDSWMRLALTCHDEDFISRVRSAGAVRLWPDSEDVAKVDPIPIQDYRTPIIRHYSSYTIFNNLDSCLPRDPVQKLFEPLGRVAHVKIIADFDHSKAVFAPVFVYYVLLKKGVTNYTVLGPEVSRHIHPLYFLNKPGYMNGNSG